MPLGLLVLLAAAGAAGVLTAGDEPRQAEPPARLGLQRTLDRLVTGPDRIAPGATAFVVGPRGVWAGAAGVANVETGAPMRPDARMRLESVSKAWTAVLLLQLAGEGRMSLADPVERWLPGLLPDGERIRVRQLLDHTSGLIDNNEIAADPDRYLARVGDARLRAELERVRRRLLADPASPFPPRLWVRLAAALPLRSPPGTRFHYSNIGYEVAGFVAERVAGKPLGRLYRERIVLPLGLASAAYDPQGGIEGRHARGYALDGEGPPVEATATGTGGAGAAGGIVANARDEARFLQALMRGKLLPPRGLRALKSVSAAARAGSYGLGLGVNRGGCAGTWYGHNGAGAGFTTSVLVSGDGRRVAVLLLNGRVAGGRGDARASAAALHLFCGA